ncbi:hypothetical protein LMG27952_03164 [Paraburkholderia hiiakae]|uniref:CD-NTase-associated protein 12/Pycsar effector protein TIR domain-containing protein n=1 Tax=Paraburkholderia hiiakae TaxID=1081782 RepID=A0ABN7HWB4_9BURK|nr:nucleotide-binding protein [Paraburkholderia hiiakae]CAD6536552.1 hypothetical protein LMG27952_03164 [Paraburkholderia hiiakae]
MRKQKEFKETRFTADVLREAIEKLRSIAPESGQGLRLITLKVAHDDAAWSYDTVDEFLADYRISKRKANLLIFGGGYTLAAEMGARETDIAIEAPTRSEIESIFDVFERSVSQCKLPPLPASAHPQRDTVVFIGHGRSAAWRDLKDHLQDKHGVKIEAYETGARAGHTIRDILEEMAQKSSFAALVMTAEDEQADGQFRARQNVIHEAGLFQGRLGFPRAILLLEEGVEEFSNVQGVQYIRFSKGNIKETFGEVLATLRREFPA